MADSSLNALLVEAEDVSGAKLLQVNGSVSMDPSTPIYVIENSPSREIFHITKDGQVVLGEGVSQDEATLEFWKAVNALREHDAFVYRVADLLRKTGVEDAEQLIVELERRVSR